ncbi:MAG: HAMP domain-containing histidine kinase [Gammaproteobacteria bacterium]|nr:HAMP domain-containing histidine kinase [Gammaproteobacteria bacterium]MBU0814145.1 HAMP domain-containing histidine kinase [Gammaproteobacteria bacterium]MBU1786335.1 HAMP domain-containing histidine kinase [Gammaproteobacteria bacterium]
MSKSQTDQTPCPGKRLRWDRRARHALAHSLRVRLVVMFVLLALAMTAIFLYGMQRALSVGWRDAARPMVADYVDRLADSLGSPPSVERAQALVQRLPITVRISGPQVNWSSHPGQEEPWRERRFRGNWGGDDWQRNEPRLLERSTADGHLIRFGLNLQIWHDQPRYVGWITLALLLLLTLLAYARVRRMLRPLDDIRAGAQRFGAGDFAQPIPVRHPAKPDELGELAATINTMAGDIHQMLDAKRTLLLAISHELRSPLTRARLNTELLPESPDVQPSRDALLRDLGQMRDMITDLLESERLASAHAALLREPTDLAALVQEVVASLPGEPAVQQHIAPGLPTLALDRARMRLLLRNLLDNALRHNSGAAQPPGIDVQPVLTGVASSDVSHLRITVRDHGPGVPEDQLPHLAQPFYRPDTARTRTAGGVGLGLYLCKLVAQAHGGSFSVRNAQPGLEVSVELPVQGN